MFGQNDNSQTANNQPNPTNTAPVMPSNPFAENDTPVPAPAPSASSSLSSTPPPATTSTPPPAAPSSTDDDLLSLKQQALQNLQPLVTHLDQTPEERFKTTMMLIQATDNSALVKQAYEAASKITDEKARAQALLDVVNEINYFTHKNDGNAGPKT
ncbi:hypothetical protein KW794_01955 [Candidatus Saccharibacteria bacterium]|nr:hypothetical protein [Candidatus Saccharibacteria bacterium]